MGFFLFGFPFFSGSAGSTEYQGNVGRLAAVFDLEFRESGEVTGSYRYPDRPGVVYRLTGTNPEPGQLFLREFTGNRETARCVLQKRMAETEIIWSGRMINADGREFAMEFSRIRDGAEPEPEVDRTLHADKVATVLGKAGELEAHLYGKLYYGWICSGVLPSDESVESLVERFRQEGVPAWAAMRFAGERVELQFEGTDGRREILQGTNPKAGEIELKNGSGIAWTGRKRVTEKVIYWLVTSSDDPSRSLLIYRPHDEIYYRDWAQDMKNLAPEAFLWSYNEWGTEFYNERFAYDSEEEELAAVSAVREEGEKVLAVEFELGSGERETVSLDPPRDRNRVPLAEGFPVSLSRIDGRIVSVLVGLTPISWRQRDEHVLELRLFPTELVDRSFNDLGESEYAASQIEAATKVAVVPDFAVIADDIYANWRIPEDKITWGIGDRGPGMLELESISLEEEPEPREPTERIGPWRPIATPIDFITNQLRIVNMSTTSGFDFVLPGNEEY